MKNTIFISYPRPFLREQKEFIETLTKFLKDNQHTVITFHEENIRNEDLISNIIKAIKGSDSFIAVAFKRYLIEEGIESPDSDNGLVSKPLKDVWLTSPYIQIELAFAYALQKPLIILTEEGVLKNGLLTKGILSNDILNFSITEKDLFFESNEWKKAFNNL